MIIIIFTATITVEIDTSTLNEKLTIGDPFLFTVTITHPESLRALGPFFDSLPEIMILDQDHKIEFEKGIRKDIYQFKAAPFRVGTLMIPPIRSVVGIETLKTGPIWLRIRALAKGMKDIDEIYEPFPFPNYLPYIIAGIIITVGILAYLGRRFLLSV
ncbi:MAG TPA: hypothetical protein EYP24_05740, partial [bacterium (Candidatus Stahlbacteria)]|nr:hypothetical protein [Candidatus Stahlbacteria bacterium]